MSEVAHNRKGEKDMVGIFFTLSVRALSDVDTYYGINVCLYWHKLKRFYERSMAQYSMEVLYPLIFK